MPKGTYFFAEEDDLIHFFMYSKSVIGQTKCELTFKVGVHKITLQERLFF